MSSCCDCLFHKHDITDLQSDIQNFKNLLVHRLRIIHPCFTNAANKCLVGSGLLAFIIVQIFNSPEVHYSPILR